MKMKKEVGYRAVFRGLSSELDCVLADLISTDTIRLEWSFDTALSRMPAPTLHVSPEWNSRNPSLHISYEDVLHIDETNFPIEVVVPDGWGWNHLSFGGDGVTGWRSIDGDWWDETTNIVDPSTDDDASFNQADQDDSISTIREKRNTNLPSASPSKSSASLMQQTLPTPANVTMEDFSFEIDGLGLPSPSRPVTPSSKGPMTPSRANVRFKPIHRTVKCDPLPGRLFEICSDTSRQGQFALQGTLVPLSPLTFISPAVPVSLPFIRVVGRRAQQASCTVTCPDATYAGKIVTSAQHLCDVSQNSIGALSWRDLRGRTVPSHKPVSLKGDIRVRVERNSWGFQVTSISFPWPKRSTEVAFSFPGGQPLSIQRATMRGVAMRRHLACTEKGAEVRLGMCEDEGMTEVVLETGEVRNDVALPLFENATGDMFIELRGDGWEGISSSAKASALI